MRSLILCGFMGCGKTTVGKALAALTGREFLDMDQEIERRAGLTVSEIFARFGEADFRRRERELCAELGRREGLVVAAGGGALTFPENAAALSERGAVVLLDVPLPVLLRRLEGDTTRPLLARPDREEAAQALYDRRLPLYRAAAGYVVNADGAPEAVARAVAKAVGE
ncbi:MAG TPA: shikimate kinase [Firmicutes bacterium]|nr:shikimate kinase [Bacillota bacterium]